MGSIGKGRLRSQKETQVFRYESSKKKSILHLSFDFPIHGEEDLVINYSDLLVNGPVKISGSMAKRIKGEAKSRRRKLKVFFHQLAVLMSLLDELEAEGKKNLSCLKNNLEEICEKKSSGQKIIFKESEILYEKNIRGSHFLVFEGSGLKNNYYSYLKFTLKDRDQSKLNPLYISLEFNVAQCEAVGL